MSDKQHPNLARDLIQILGPLIRDVKFITSNPWAANSHLHEIVIKRNNEFVARIWFENRQEGVAIKYSTLESWSEGFGSLIRFNEAVKDGYWHPGTALSVLLACLSVDTLPEDILLPLFKPSQLVPRATPGTKIPSDGVRTVFKKLMSFSGKKGHFNDLPKGVKALVEMDPIIKEGFMLIQEKFRILPTERVLKSFQVIKHEMKILAKHGVGLTEENIVALWRESVVAEIMES